MKRFSFMVVSFSLFFIGCANDAKKNADLTEMKCGYGYGYNYSHTYDYGCDYGDGAKNEDPNKPKVQEPGSMISKVVAFDSVVHQKLDDSAYLTNLVVCENNGKIPVKDKIKEVKIEKTYQEFNINPGYAIQLSGKYLARVNCVKFTK